MLQESWDLFPISYTKIAMLENFSLLPPDSTFSLLKRFQEDPRKEKIDLGIGIYHAEDGRASPFRAIEEAKKIWCKKDQEASYTTITGNDSFSKLLGELILGERLFSALDEKIALGQSIGGTGALFVIAKTLSLQLTPEIYIPTLTWGNHTPIFAKCGYEVLFYPYFCEEEKALAFSSMKAMFEETKPRSIIVFHASCHNPTGTDLSHEEWEEILAICKKKDLFPLFDLAYAGMGRGVEEDCFAIRLFAQSGIEMGIACSCSKNFGLYRERVGAFFLITKNRTDKEAIQSQLRSTIRSTYSNPPSYGAKLVESILLDKRLRSIWEEELEFRRRRMVENRKVLVRMLCEKIGEKYRFLENQVGMFSFLPMDGQKVEKLIGDHALYLLQNGRINVSGLTQDNLPRVAEALANVLQ